MKGLHTHRLSNNPLEQRFADAWENASSQSLLLEYVLSEDNNEPQPVDKHDKVVVATMMQWLGSPVGQEFLSTALGFSINKHVQE